MSVEQPFVHLHVHTEFSLLDGLSKINKLVARAQELEMKSLAITDHGTMYGVMQFYRACKDASIKPIIGVESYMARKSRLIHDATERQPYHLLLLAKNETGYKNLLKLTSEAQLTGFYSKPRVDKELLSKYHEGLICTSGCLAAEIPRAFGEGRESQALDLIGTYQDIFGKENFFLELQQHDIPEIHKLNEWLVQYRGKADVPLVATNDVHYVLDTDFNAHDTLLCIQTNAFKKDEKRMRMSDPSYHLRTPAEMWSIFGEAAPESLMNTLLIAEMCDLKLDDKTYHLPVFPVPEGYTAASYLQALTLRGARWRWGEDADQHRERLDYELGIISKMGFDTYFLIVWDLCEFARKADIWWNVRGSGAGSAVAYCLGITSIDPIQNNLIFERFLNPGRVSMPDIDMDFPDDRRSEMIDYAKRKYGEDKVAAIITFGTLKARAAIKDVGRVLDYPLAEVSKLTQMIPQIPSHPVTLAQCLSDDPEYALPELKKLYAENAEIKTLLDTALTVEGMSRNAGTHAAGIIIGDKPLVEYLPLHRPTNTGGDVAINRITQFPMEICESIGLLKVDFLGLSTLTIMRKACELIERYYGIHYDMSNIPYRPDPNDPEQSRMLEAAFKLISSGEVTGVFQLEGQGMRKMLVDMKPSTFEHIIAAISLYRPGPMQFIPMFNNRLHGTETIEYLHPDLEDILSETYGVIVYQEQIQQIAAKLFGYSLGDADLMRRAVSKKKAKDLIKHKEIFKEKGPEYGVTPEVAEKIFDQVEYFAAYGFNKCLVADTQIIDADTGRLVRIGDLVEGKVALTKTIACDTDKLRLISGKVSLVHSNGVKPVYRLITGLGKQIDATANHPFLTFAGWRNLSDLAVSDQIAVPRKIAIQGTKEWADHEVIVLGHLLAEGNLCHPHGLYYYTSDDEQWRDYVKNLEKFENVAASTHFRRNNMHDVYSRKVDPKLPNSAVAWIEELGLRNADSYTKFIPDEVFELTHRQIALLIARMWEGDGCIDERGRYLYYATSSERMGRQLQHLFLRFSIPSRIRQVMFKYRGGQKFGYQIHITGNRNLKHFLDTIASHFISDERRTKLKNMVLDTPASTSTKDCVPVAVQDMIRATKIAQGHSWDTVAQGAGVSVSEFRRTAYTPTKSGYTHAVIDKLAAFFDSDELRRYADNDVYWDRIVSIEYIGEQPTYDLTVLGTHNFVANDIIVHNSHASDYAILTCQTAFLKAHYSPEFYTAMLSVQRDRIDDVALFTSDCRRLGIPILPPSLNHSEQDFTIEETEKGRGIRFGLGAIKNAGDKATAAIPAERAANGPFTSLLDFCRRVDLRLFGKRGLEPMIKVGVFDEFGERDQLLSVAERLNNYSADQHRAKEVGQASLFANTTEDMNSDVSFLAITSSYEKVSKRDMLRWEKELMGLYISDHPLNAWSAAMQNLSNLVLSGQLKADGDQYHERAITVAGLAVGTRTIVTKKGDTMAIVTLEDAQGNMEAVFFPRTWTRYKDMIEDDKIYIVRGRADTSREGSTPQIIVESVSQDFDYVVSADEATPAPPDFVRAVNAPDENEMLDSHDADEPTTDGLPDSLFEGAPPEAPDETESFEPLYTPPRRQSSTNSSQLNGNGVQQTTQPAQQTDTSPYDDEPPALPARRITVFFAPPGETEKERQKWLNRIKRIRGQLIECPGRDLLTLCIPDGGIIHALEYPNHRINYEDVRPILERNFPPDAVRVELLPDV